MARTKSMIFSGTLIAFACIAAQTQASGMRLERERLFTLEGPETVGFLKPRFDFQHNFKDQTLNPVVDLTVAYGIWTNVQIEGEVLLNNLKVSAFGRTVVSQYNVINLGLKWAVLDQTKEDWFSLAIGTSLGRTDTKSEFRDPAAPIRNLARDHYRNQGAYAVVHYDWPLFSQYVSVQYASFKIASSGEMFDVVTPGIGERIKVYKSKDAEVHLVGDYQFKAFDGAKRAWGAGVQLMYNAPHIFSFFVSNTFGDTTPEGVLGVDENFYNFRWSYRF